MNLTKKKMKMKKYMLFGLVFAFLAGMTSCGDDFLTSSPTSSQEAGGPATEGAILSNLGATYQPLLLDSYANQNYNSLVLMSDLRSDDIYKGGGDAGDQRQLYLLSQFTATPSDNFDGIWSVLYNGLARANNVITACENAVDVDEASLTQYKAEAHFLRAYYMHWLWKFWGNVPYFETALEAPYVAPQYTADEIYAEIMEDLDVACAEDALVMRPSGADLGRVGRAAALMLRARVVMYQKDATQYGQVTADMAEIINSGEFTLDAAPGEIFLDEGEFGPGSIFESNQIPEGKTWGSGWGGYGTNLPAFISPNNLATGADPENGTPKGGWGFGPVRTAALAIYEDGDLRKDASINQFDEADYTARFQDTGLFLAKYCARVGYNPPPGDVDLNYSNNVRIFRFAEALLNYAEMVIMNGQTAVDGVTAAQCLNLVRARAFGATNDITPSDESIKAERRREFFGEGMRFWDLVRWGDTALLNDNDEFSSRTWSANQKYLPIPQAEIEKTIGTAYPLQQNP